MPRLTVKGRTCPGGLLIDPPGRSQRDARSRPRTIIIRSSALWALALKSWPTHSRPLLGENQAGPLRPGLFGPQRTFSASKA
jgi:hypothetical protein